MVVTPSSPSPNKPSPPPPPPPPSPKPPPPPPPPSPPNTMSPVALLRLPPRPPPPPPVPSTSVTPLTSSSSSSHESPDKIVLSGVPLLDGYLLRGEARPLNAASRAACLLSAAASAASCIACSCISINPTVFLTKSSLIILPTTTSSTNLCRSHVELIASTHCFTSAGDDARNDVTALSCDGCHTSNSTSFVRDFFPWRVRASISLMNFPLSPAARWCADGGEWE